MCYGAKLITWSWRGRFFHSISDIVLMQSSISSISPVLSTYITYTESIVFFIALTDYDYLLSFVRTCDPNYFKNFIMPFRFTGTLISSYFKQLEYTSSRESLWFGINGFLILRDSGKIPVDFLHWFDVFAPNPKIAIFVMLV